ncbi:hypothetical protein [Bradyrhizobium diazoefficiens]|uniref:hypothetical protein n=1 Tax=Bradyrhizobium diazoefficiens TaxID=1355477 RepID=UPI000D72547C|nr:hypothetical protein [Bradyrhizobium diazoefficiens]AWO92416.1 hypothetical protein DI395_30600 [Bradyrhizobium diazoefficiens]
MSPAAKRPYVVGFKSSATYETTVLAKNEREAVVQGKILYDLYALAYFSASDSGKEVWHAQVLDQEARS